MYVPKYKIGDVFSETKNGKTVYWKITKFIQGTDEKNAWKSSSYITRKCNKNGKEFENRGSFYAVGIDEQLSGNYTPFNPHDSVYKFIAHVSETVTVSQVNKYVGRNKRVINNCKNRIVADLKMIERLGEIDLADIISTIDKI